MPIDWVSAGIQIGSSLIGGISNAVNSKAEHEATLAELRNQIDLLNYQSDALVESTDRTAAELNLSLGQAINSNNYNLGISKKQQEENAEIASIAAVFSSGQMYDQLADLQRENLSAIGSSVQGAAVSGFRRTAGTTTGALITETERRADENYARALENIKMSAFETFYKASNDYFSANVQQEVYRQAIRDAEASTALKLENLYAERDSQLGLYEAQKEQAQGQIDAMGEWEWWDEGILSFLGGL